MKLSISKFELALAERGLNPSDLRKYGITSNTVANVRKGNEIKPKNAGEVAKALGVEVASLVLDEEAD